MPNVIKKNQRKIDFEEFEEARLTAGFSVSKTCSELCVTLRTYYRWKAGGTVPALAFRCLERSTGSLAHYGWKKWEIREGRLYNVDLHHSHHFTAQDLQRTFYQSHPLGKFKPRLVGGKDVNGVNRQENAIDKYRTEHSTKDADNCG